MQSGTLLHLALLRKTSTAHKNSRSHTKRGSNIAPCLPEENFTLSGWSTEDHEFIQLCQPPPLAKERHYLRQRSIDKRNCLAGGFSLKEKKKTDGNYLKQETLKPKPVSNRIDSQNKQKRSYSERNCFHNKSMNDNSVIRDKNTLQSQNTKRPPTQKFKSFNLFKPMSKLQQLTAREDCKENSKTEGTVSLIKVPYHPSHKNKNREKRSFANFINLTNIRARRFFKNQ